MASEWIREQKSIRICHFVNPTQFWYIESGFPSKALQDTRRVEETLQLSLNKNKCHPHTFAVGTKVAVFYLPWTIYIRAQVLKTKVKEYILWAIDYGFPFVTSRDHICHLPSNCAETFDYVRAGGVNKIFPAVKTVNSSGNNTMKLQASWNTRICQELIQLINDSSEITFHEQLQHTSGKFYGDLRLLDCAGRTILVSDYLIFKEAAVRYGENFQGQAFPKDMPLWFNSGSEETLRINKAPSINIMAAGIRKCTVVQAKQYKNSCLKVMEWLLRNNQQGTNSLNERPDTSEDIHEDLSIFTKPSFSPTFNLSEDSNAGREQSSAENECVRKQSEGLPKLLGCLPPTSDVKRVGQMSNMLGPYNTQSTPLEIREIPNTPSTTTPVTSSPATNCYEPNTASKYPKTYRVPPVPKPLGTGLSPKTSHVPPPDKTQAYAAKSKIARSALIDSVRQVDTKESHSTFMETPIEDAPISK